jgi:outer membrane receptor for ferric coprogen and ferric-rhodotorulic acid
VKQRFVQSLAVSALFTACAVAHAAPIEVNVPALPLADAIRHFEAQSGVRVQLGATLEGETSSAVQGTLEPAEALRQLLAGTGMRADVQGDSATLTRVAGREDELNLGQMSIVAERGSVTTTEGTGAYTTGIVNSSTKLPMSIRETPQSVSVITHQRIEDQGLSNLHDIVQNTTGLSIEQMGPERQRYYARGFPVDNLMYDGLPISLSQFSQDVMSAPDSAMLDRVEVVRGATGLMQGSGNPSAAINMIRKRPTAEPYVSLGASAGSWDRYRTEVDASNALNEAGTLRGRIVTAYEDNGTFQDYGSTEHSFVYGITEADITENTLLTVGASYQNDNKESDWGGLPTAFDGSNLGLSRSSYLGNDWAHWDTNTRHLFGSLEHRFDNDWKMRLAANKTWGRIDMLGSYFTYSRDGRLDQGSGSYKYTDNYDSYDGNLSGPFTLFGRRHEAVIGASQRKEVFDGHGGWTTTATNVDPYGWDSGAIAKPDIDMGLWTRKFDIDEKGFYAATRLSLADPLHVILGGRLDWYDYSDANAANSYKVTRNVTRYAGVIYDLNDTYSVYASYTDIFKPQNNLDASGDVIEPMTGTNYEIGLKGEYLDGRLNASAAVFRMLQENRSKLLESSACPNPSVACYEAAGEVESKGIDLELAGLLAQGWEASIGYTYVEATYRKDSNANNEGRLFDPRQPRHQFKASTTYHLPGALDQWRIGGSLSSRNSTFQQTQTYRTEQDAYTLVNLMLGYRVNEHLDTRVNLNNVFDKTYFSSINSNASVAYGEPRNLMFSLKWTL